jgi:hypothetical protein
MSLDDPKLPNDVMQMGRFATAAFIQKPTPANLPPRPQFRPQLVKAAIPPQHGEVVMGQIRTQQRCLRLAAN